MPHLIIAEKPSVAQSIAKVLGVTGRCTKPFKRLWISSMEDSAIHEGFENLKPSSECPCL